MNLVGLFSNISTIQQHVQVDGIAWCALEQWLTSYSFNIIQQVMASANSVLNVQANVHHTEKTLELFISVFYEFYYYMNVRVDGCGYEKMIIV